MMSEKLPGSSQSLPTQLTLPDRSFQASSRWTGQGTVGVPCALCGVQDCQLYSHKSYLSKLRNHGFRQTTLTPLMNTSFSSSYTFNPLSVAVDNLCADLRLEFDQSILGDHTSLPSALHKLVSYDIGRNTPFTDPSGNVMGEVAAEWLIAASVDELACASSLNLWVTIEHANTQNPGLERYNSKLNTSFLTVLRERLQDKQSVSDGTIFAASNHLATCHTFIEMNNEQRNIMMNGLEALVNSRGGIERLTESSPGLLQSLLWADLMNAWLTGTRPRFHIKSPPSMPLSFIPERTLTSDIPAVYRNCCGPDLLDTAKYLRFFLLFRHGTEIRNLTKPEYQYIVALERFIHIQLLDQQARYNDTGSTSECIVLAMGLVRMRILCTWEQHFLVRKVHTQRLMKAMTRLDFETWCGIDALPALIWLCWVLLAQAEPFCDEQLILGLLRSALRELFNEDDMSEWPAGWSSQFSDWLEPLLWHSDYTGFIPIVADLVLSEGQDDEEHSDE